jgi:NADH-quinone oxidoreductase subunit L
VARIAQKASGALRLTQTGIVQNYALSLVLGVVIVIGIMLFGI